jgi:plasmid stability protein
MALHWKIIMPSIQIKNVPPDVHRVLRSRAAEEGMSLQEYLLAKLTEEARQPTPKEFWERVGQRTGGGRLTPQEAAEYIRAEREARESREW